MADRPNRWTPAEERAAITAYHSGSWAAVYALFPGINRSTLISRVTRLPGWQKKRRVWTTIEVKTLCDLRNMGLSSPEIARRLGRSCNSVEMKLGEQRRRGTVRRQLAPPLTEGQKRALQEQVDYFIEAMMRRFNRRHSTVRKWIIRSAMSSTKRNRARKLEIA
jgi:hypothetical protein